MDSCRVFGRCSLISFPVRSLGHCLFGFLLLYIFLFCTFESLLCDFPASSLVPLGPSLSSSGTAALLRSPLGLPVLSYASLQSWASLIVILFFVSGLLVGSPSLSVCLSAVPICVGLLPFLPVFVSSASPCRCFGSGPYSFLFDVTFIIVLAVICGVHSFAFCFCLIGICSLVSFLYLREFTMRFSCVFLGSFGASLPSSGTAALLRSPFGLPVLSYASLQSWASLIVILFSVSGLLVGSPSLSVRLSAVSVCVGLLPFLPVFVSSASPCRCFSSGPYSFLFDITFIIVLAVIWCVHSFAFCFCLVGICSLVLEWASFFFGVWCVCSSLRTVSLVSSSLLSLVWQY